MLSEGGAARAPSNGRRALLQSWSPCVGIGFARKQWVISLALAVVVLGAYWLTRAPKLQAVNHPSGRDLNTQDVHKLYPPGAATAQPPSAALQ